MPYPSHGVLGTASLAGIPSANAKVFILPTYLPFLHCAPQLSGWGLPCIYLPTTGEGWPKATTHETTCMLEGQNLDYHCHCPPKTLIKLQETGATVTPALKVLHLLQWQEPSKGGQTRPCSSSHPGLSLLHSTTTWWCS